MIDTSANYHPRKLSKNLHLLTIILILVILVTYNVQVSFIRLLFVIILMVAPLVILWRKNFSTNIIIGIIGTTLLFCVMFASVLVNANTFELNISGPQAEILAAFVGFSFVFYIAFAIEVQKSRLDFPKLFSQFLFFYTVILLFDTGLRYYLEPGCFLNYFCRKSAKTVGLFSTTNVTGANIVTILMVLISSRQFSANKIIFIILHIVLITTMARAAIIAYFAVFSLYYIFNSTFLVKALFGITFFTSILIILITNPYDILNDGSFMSKLDFLQQSYLIAQDASLKELAFGFGASFNAVAEILNVSGWSPHLPFLKAFFYFGIPGLLAYFVSLLVMVYVGGRSFLWPLMVNQVTAMAGGPMYSPALTCALIFTYLLRTKLRKDQFYGT